MTEFENGLEHETWYWMSHPHEGDIFYPIFIVDNKSALLDGKLFRLVKNTKIIFTKAIMPKALQGVNSDD